MSIVGFFQGRHLSLLESEVSRRLRRGQNADEGVWEALLRECYKFAIANYTKSSRQPIHTRSESHVRSDT
jgi:hypothetical protein